MYLEKDGETFLKLYSGTDWVWYRVRLKKTDVDYLRKHWTGVKASAPTLIKKYKKYYLVFAFKKNVQLPEKEAEERVICGVDLGINTDAVCSIMHSDGTVSMVPKPSSGCGIMHEGSMTIWRSRYPGRSSNLQRTIMQM